MPEYGLINAKPPGATNTERLHIDFLLPDAPGRYKSESTSELYHFQSVLTRGVFFIPKRR
jgi:hypothetical protein